MADPKSDLPVRNVKLRKITLRDLPTLFEHQRDPEAIRMAVVYPRDWVRFKAHWEEILLDGDIFTRAILFEGALVGYITCFPMEGLQEVGYWVDKAHWGRGIATRALQLLLDKVRHRPLIARVARTNLGSLQVLKRCGFTLEKYHLAPATERFPACEEAIMKIS